MPCSEACIVVVGLDIDILVWVTCNDAVVVSMVVTTTLSTKSETAVTMNTDATPNEASTIIIQM